LKVHEESLKNTLLFISMVYVCTSCRKIIPANVYYIANRMECIRLCHFIQKQFKKLKNKFITFATKVESGNQKRKNAFQKT